MNKLREELGDERLWGLPKELSDELVESYEKTISRKIGKWLVLVCLLASFASIIPIWLLCENFAKRNAINLAESLDGFAYQGNFGIGLVLGMPLILFFSGIMMCLIFRLVPMPAKAALFIGAHQKHPKRKGGKKKYSAIPNPPTFPFVGKISDIELTTNSVDAVINSYAMTFLAKCGKFLSPFVILITGIIYIEISRLSVLSPTGMHKTKLFSSELNFKSWQDVETVTLGCKRRKTRHAKSVSKTYNEIVYSVKWADGQSTSLKTKNQLNGKLWLENFELVDAEIRAGNAIFEHWSGGIKRDPMHPICLEHFRKTLGSDLTPRFYQLIRFGKQLN